MITRRGGVLIFPLVLVLAAAWLALSPGTASALPLLQLYIEGANYDTSTQTWVTLERNFKLYVVGDLSGHSDGPIVDLKLAVAFYSDETGSVSITGSNATMLTDPSTATTPGSPYLSSDGEIPTLSDGSLLPSHSIYTTGVSFMEYSLADMTLEDSPIGDFQYTFPTSFPNTGEIQAYDVTVSGYSAVHFDTYNHVQGSNFSSFAPFSHDAGVVPEPATVTLLGLGLLLVGFLSCRREH